MMDGLAERFLLNLLGYLMLFLCAAMCYMPVTSRLRIGVKRLLALTIPTLSVCVIAGAFVSAYFGVTQNAVTFPLSVLFFLAYYKTLDADLFECLSIFLFVMSLACYPFHYALMLDAATNPAGTYSLFPAWVEAVQEIMMLAVAAAFFLIRRHVAEFTESMKTLPMRRIVWIVPFIFVVVLLIFIPIDYNTLYTGRMLALYPVFVTFTLTAEAAIVYIFHRFTSELLNNEQLEQKNQMLEFQSTRYELLRNHIEETAGLRHDFRQQLRTVSSLVENENYAELKDYLSEYAGRVAGAEWSLLCKNGAVDAIAGYYQSIARARGIETDWRFELPKELPLPESVFCGMLGNLLENSIDGCETLRSGERVIRLSAQMPSSSMLALVIENSFDGAVRTGSAGELVSSKHKGPGMGLRSVRAAVEKYRGQMQVDHDGKTFRVSVLLNF